MQTLRRPVALRDCDILGHMNIAAYVDAVSDAMFSVQGAIGLRRRDIEVGQISFVRARIEADYKSELLAGDVVEMDSQILHIGTKSIRVRHRLTRLDDGVLAFEAVTTSVLFDLKSRSALAIPDEMRQALDALREDQDET